MRIKLILMTLFCMLCSSTLYAGYDEAKLKKLFTDKQQRAQIDAARSGNNSGIESQQKTTSKISVSGYMKRSDGKSVVWMNGKNTMEDPVIGSAKAYPESINKKNKVPVRIDGRMVYIKPGESWTESTDKVNDDY